MQPNAYNWIKQSPQHRTFAESYFPVMSGLAANSNGWPGFAHSVQMLPAPLRQQYIEEWNTWHNRFGKNWKRMGGLRETRVGQYTDRYLWRTWKPSLGALGTKYGRGDASKRAFGQLDLGAGQGWLDNIVDKGKSVSTCDVPFTADEEAPLSKKPANAVTTAREGDADMIPVYNQLSPSTWACKDWYYRMFVIPEPEVEGGVSNISVNKYWNKVTNKTVWTVSVDDIDWLKRDYPSVYALLAPLPPNVPISPEPTKPIEEIKEKLEKYIGEVGSEDPEVPKEAQPEKLQKAGFPKWLLAAAGIVFIGGLFAVRGKKKGGRKKSRSRRRR